MVTASNELTAISLAKKEKMDQLLAAPSDSREGVRLEIAQLVDRENAARQNVLSIQDQKRELVNTYEEASNRITDYRSTVSNLAAQVGDVKSRIAAERIRTLQMVAKRTVKEKKIKEKNSNAGGNSNGNGNSSNSNAGGNGNSNGN